MNAFFISQGGDVTGPFMPGQIVSMWDAGTLTADALIRAGDSKTWKELREEIETLRTASPKVKPSHALGWILALISLALLIFAFYLG